MSHKEFEKNLDRHLGKIKSVDLGKSAFENWIKPLNLTEIDKKTAFFVSPTGFIGDWVNRNYGEKIIEVMWECGFEVDRLKFSSRLSPRKISKEENKQDNNQNIIADKGVLIQSDTEVPGFSLIRDLHLTASLLVSLTSLLTLRLEEWQDRTQCHLIHCFFMVVSGWGKLI